MLKPRSIIFPNGVAVVQVIKLMLIKGYGESPLNKSVYNYENLCPVLTWLLYQGCRKPEFEQMDEITMLCLYIKGSGRDQGRPFHMLAVHHISKKIDSMVSPSRTNSRKYIAHNQLFVYLTAWGSAPQPGCSNPQLTSRKEPGCLSLVTLITHRGVSTWCNQQSIRGADHTWALCRRTECLVAQRWGN